MYPTGYISRSGAKAQAAIRDCSRKRVTDGDEWLSPNKQEVLTPTAVRTGRRVGVG